MKPMQSGTTVESHILLKAADDAEFRERMVQDPKAAIEEATGRTVPDDALVFIKQTIADTQEREKASGVGPLTRDELVQVVGGIDLDGNPCTDRYRPTEDWSGTNGDRYDDC